MTTLSQLTASWQDTPGYHKQIHESFVELVDAHPLLSVHRNYVQERVYGMGERSFWWLWKLILDELPDNPRLLEIGVFKAATVSLWKLLREDADCYGITPLDGRGTGWVGEDYAGYIEKIHDDFDLAQPTLFVGGSEEPGMVELAKKCAPFDVIYVDGNHSYEGCLSDLTNYAPLVKKSGYLVIDDACNDMNQLFGYFQGIQTVTDATLAYINSDWEFVGNVVHLRVYRRK